MKRNPLFLLPLLLTALSGLVRASTIEALVEDAKGKPIENAVVIAIPVAGIKTLPKAKEEIVDQIDREFVPYVKPVLVGSYVRFPNKDNIRHNVYSFSAAKSFELPLYTGTAAAPVLFDKPGVVVLGCNIHDWMLGYVYVSESPFFAKTGPDGRAVLENLARDEYRIRVWHPDLDGTEDGTARVLSVDGTTQYRESWKLGLKATIHVHRTHPAGLDSYR